MDSDERIALCRCLAIKFMYERMALKWVLEHQFNFLRALLFVIMDLTSEVSAAPLVFMFSLSPLGVHVFSQPPWCACFLSASLVFMFSLSPLGVHVFSQPPWCACFLSAPLVFMFSLSPLGVHVFSQPPWCACFLSAPLVFMFSLKPPWCSCFLSAIGGCNVLTAVGNTANSTWRSSCVMEKGAMFDFSHVQLPISSGVHSSVQDGIYALGKAHMCSTLSLRSLKFPQCCLWNSFSVRLIDDGPLSSFQGRSSSIFTAMVYYCVFKHSKCPPGLTATQQSRSLVPSVVSVNENLHIAHEHFCTKPCVFTAPDTHSAHTQVLTS